MKIASERMDTGAVQDMIAEKILSSFVSIAGDVFTDDYGTTMIVRKLNPEVKEVKAEAIRMLEVLEG